VDYAVGMLTDYMKTAKPPVKEEKQV